MKHCIQVFTERVNLLVENRLSTRSIRWAINYWVPIVLGIWAFVSIGAIVLIHGSVMSVFDEWGYIDYLFKIPTQLILHKGEQYSPEALKLMACYGEVPFGPMGSKCGSNLDVSSFPNHGIVTADANTPLYFWSIWVVGIVFKFFTFIPEITQWRLANICWLVAGLLYFYKLGRFWNIRKTTLFVLGLVIIGSPFSYWAFSYLSTDAPSFFFGSLLLFLCSKYLATNTSNKLLIAISITATLFKVTNYLGVVLAILLIFGMHLQQRKKELTKSSLNGISSIKLMKTTLLMAVLPPISVFIWLKTVDALAVSNIIVEQGVSSELTWYELIRLTGLFTGTLGMTFPVNGLPGLNMIPLPDYVLAPLAWIIAGGVLAGFWSQSSGSNRAAFAFSTLFGLLFAGPALAIVLQVQTGEYFSLPPRYLAVLLPAALISVGFTIRNKLALALLASYAVCLQIGLIAASVFISSVPLG